jgi:alginate O-acetyltransferase complex protein AlgI
MSIVLILASILVAALIGFIKQPAWRVYLLLAASTLAIFVLQPTLPIRGLDFYLPILTLGLTIGGWVITSPPETRTWKVNWLGALIPAGIVLLLSMSRFLGFTTPLTASRPPQTTTVLLFLGSFSIIILILTIFLKSTRVVLGVGFLVVLLLFVVLKVPFVSLQVSIILRSLTGQALATASPFDIRWLGYSYIAFRILHTIRDRQTGRLPPVTLAEYVVYVIFFPALSAGPIDRIERFIGDLRKTPQRTAEDWGTSSQRIVMGLFKKFVIADGLSIMALNAINAPQIQSSGWGWIMLYAYAFQLFFDFSGYTDIAIGTARLLGIKLPENFNHPYLKSNLTQFWNNWHMTLTQWFRAYFFNPITRALRSRKNPVPIPVIIFVTQLGTMLLIGLWHGVSFNFILFGLWHGIGLFIHNRWSDWTKAWFAQLTSRWQKVLNLVGTVLTFHFVALSWIFFALPNPSTSWNFFRVLIGLT